MNCVTSLPISKTLCLDSNKETTPLPIKQGASILCSNVCFWLFASCHRVEHSRLHEVFLHSTQAHSRVPLRPTSVRSVFEIISGTLGKSVRLIRYVGFSFPGDTALTLIPVITWVVSTVVAGCTQLLVIPPFKHDINSHCFCHTRRSRCN